MSNESTDTTTAPAAVASAPRNDTSAAASNRPPELRLALLTLLLPLYISVVFAANYFGALHAPKPHDVKVAIVGAPSRTAPLAHRLSITPDDGFAVSQLADIPLARKLVDERKLAGAYLTGPRRAPVLIVATAASPSLANFVETTFRKVAAAEGRPLAVDDVRPLPADNASESPNFFLLVICTLAGFLTIAALGVVAPTLPEHHRLAIAAVASLSAPILAYLIGGPGYHTFSGSFGTIVAMLGLGALYAFAAAAITRILQLGLGAVGTLVGSLVLIFLNLPSSGGSVAVQLLPGFWRFLSHFWIGEAALDANRSALYFGGTGVATDVLKIFAWVAACAALLAGPTYLRSKRQARTEAPTTTRAEPHPV